MDKHQNEEARAYAAPEVKDYGTLEQLTAAGGNSFVDSPVGTPIGSVTAGEDSTP
jgi:hypothetical protein